MDWPAEVNAGQPFRTRLIVWGVCAANPQFHPGASADQSAVTFAPFFVTDDHVVMCLAEPTVRTLIVNGFDTAGMAPGLAAPASRIYHMRGAIRGVDRITLQTFGDVLAKPSSADGSRREAAGFVSKVTDIEGCSRIAPGGYGDPSKALVLEDQADTTSISYGFVRGYIYEAPTPVCGQTTVFHLVSGGIN